ncbi:ankyrin repeat domain-containing protein 16 [Trichonephila inaurata madagascariensis]|uniref:Ankyrin repeat domain-containing protein 16 n=1 Tax=Trichonephila inaurata madagascariensis TaxID=2747483 RepID=A0A8X6X698_9ARAC|nr:ankyrin repeat domain-containing protein 16 [Trichonephila inaurata madagascariensis]
MIFNIFKENLLEAAQHNDFSVFLNLISDHSSFAHRWKELTTKNGDTVLHLAAHSGCVDIIKFYADNWDKRVLESRNNDGKTPLHIASHSNHLECVKYLLSCGVSVNALKRSDWTPLMLACTKSNLDIVKELLLHSADLNILNKDGWTAFHIASREGNPEIIKCLLDFNSSVWKTKSKNGRTPLHTAALHGHLDIVKIFIENTNYDINVKDSCGITPIMDAVSGNHNHVVKFFIENGSSLKEEDKLGRNVLHIAAEAGNLECIRWLVKTYYMSLDSQTLQGLSPLHFACKENNIDTFNLLLKLGANCDLKDKRGRSALEYASIKEIPSSLMYLSKK